MPKKVRSARGVTIDWDHLTIKNQMSSKPAPHTVQQRQDFIDSKMRRRVNTVKGQLAKAKNSKLITPEVAEEPVVAEPKTQKKRPIKRKTTTTPTEE